MLISGILLYTTDNGVNLVFAVQYKNGDILEIQKFPITTEMSCWFNADLYFLAESAKRKRLQENQ